MHPRDLFGVVVRAIGFWLLVVAVTSLASAIVAPGILISVVLNSAVGVLLIAKADAIVGGVYGRPKAPEMI